jgi:hypothetical protein
LALIRAHKIQININFEGNKNMKGIFAILVPILALGGLMYYADSMAPDDQKPYQLSELAKAGSECDLISEKAAMKLPEGLEFQRLEKAGRKARVLETCMNDRGYVENPAWALFAKLQAEQEAAKLSAVSQDEAYETLRRKYMLIYQAEKSEPIYWLKSKQ